MAVRASGNNPVFIMINGWSKQVDAFIEAENLKLKGGSPSPNIEAAIKVSLALGNAAVAYNYSGAWRTSTDKVDDVVKKQLDELQKMVETLNSSNTLAIQGLASRAQDLVRSLKLFDWQTQVTDVFPKYVTMSQDQFKVSISGRFQKPANRGRYDLSIFNKRAGRLSATPDSLSFTGVIPKHLIPDSLNHNCRFIQGTLEVEGYNSKVYSNNVTTSTFTVWFGVYPLYIGDITVISNKVSTLVRPFKSAKMVLDPKDFPKGELVERKFSIYPTSGWRFNIRDRHPMVMVNGKFDQSLRADQYDEKSITFTMKLTSEKIIEEQVEFEETKDEVQPEEILKSVQLKWGEECLLEKVPGQKFRQIKYRSFDNQEFVINGPDETKPYLKVRECVVGLRLFAEAPK